MFLLFGLTQLSYYHDKDCRIMVNHEAYVCPFDNLITNIFTQLM